MFWTSIVKAPVWPSKSMESVTASAINRNAMSAAMPGWLAKGSRLCV
jgi:hypothetical protein